MVEVLTLNTTVKVRMQMKPGEAKGAAVETNTGTFGTAMRILRSEGVRGLYAGVCRHRYTSPLDIC
jgi:hypothetical protein